MNRVYGIEKNDPYTAVDVRDAIIRCFEQAHGTVTKKSMESFTNNYTQQEMDELVRKNIEDIIKNAFKETGGNYDNPDKESLIKVIDWLRTFSIKFRQPEVIEKHYGEIKELIRGL